MSASKDQIDDGIDTIINRMRAIAQKPRARASPSPPTLMKRARQRAAAIFHAGERRLLLHNLEAALVKSRKFGGVVKRGTPCLYCAGSSKDHTLTCARRALNARQDRREGMFDAIYGRPMQQGRSISYERGYVSVFNLGDMVD